MLYRIITLCFFYLAIWQASAQVKSPVEAQIKLIAKYDGKQVKLRWAPDQAHAWHLLNQTGYVVERYTVVENGAMVAGKPPKKILTARPLLPWPEAKWADIGHDNPTIAMAYQALIGPVKTSFGQASGLAQVTDLRRADQNRYSYALYAADVEPQAATALGLAFTDTQVSPHSQYTYVVRPAQPDKNYRIDEAVISVETAQAATLPPIQTVKVISLDKMIRLAVNISMLKDRYTAYIVEKKEEQIERFRPLDRPMQVHLDPKGKPLNWMETVDTLARNHDPVWYRIRGVDAFGDSGPYSAVIQTRGRDLFDGGQAPVIDTLINRNNRWVELQWSFSESATAERLELFKASRIDGPYQLIDEIIPPAPRGSYTDEAPANSNYYKVVAYDAAGKRAESHPKFVQLEDNTPPSAPQNLRGSIDSTGQVTLTWSANSEADLLGYRVFTSNTERGEWIELTHDIISDHRFVYRISLNNLTPDIYYRVRAMDRRFNQSPYSATNKLTKPDLLPPVPAQIKDYHWADARVTLTFRASSSPDVARYELWAVPNEKSLETWKNDKLPTQFELSLPFGTAQTLQLVTIDEAGNQAVGEPLLIRAPDASVEHKEGLRARAQPAQKRIELRWKQLREAPQQWYLYKAIDNGPWRLYQMLDATATSYHDYFLKVNNRYRYKLKSVVTDATTETWSNEVELTYGK